MAKAGEANEWMLGLVCIAYYEAYVIVQYYVKQA
jgi:hypothetical protein